MTLLADPPEDDTARSAFSEELSEEEAYLFAILSDPSGVELAEFSWCDEESVDGCYRLYPFQWCFSGDTPILTKNGSRRIEDVVGRVTVLTESVTGPGRWVEAEVRGFGQQRIVELTVERDRVEKVIRTTAEHRWFAASEARRADRKFLETCTTALRPGMRLQGAHPRRSALNPAPFGAIHGFCWGDGTRAKTGATDVVVWGEKLKAVGHLLPGPGVAEKREDVAVEGRRWSLLPRSFKEPVSFDEAPSYLYGWLAGYFAADGSISGEVGGFQCTISSTSLASLTLARDVCIRLGITVGDVAGHPIEGGYSARDDRSQYVLTIRAADLDASFFLLPSHRARWLRHGHTGYPQRQWKVKSVRVTDSVEPVYCAVVPETHSFVLDGYILTGNCWWRDDERQQIDQCARAIGKSESLKARACAFPFNHPDGEFVITAPQGIHADAITDRIESQLTGTRLLSEMVLGGRSGISHKPFKCRFKNGARIIGRIPQQSGIGLKGCMAAGTLVLAKRGLVPIEDLVAGDEVYTHRNRWRPVLALQSYLEEDAWLVKGVGAVPLVVSAGHKFLVRPNLAANPAKQKRELGDERWCEAPGLRPAEAYWCSPAEFHGTLPFAGPESTDPHARSIPVTEDLWWLAGRYVADGYIDWARTFPGWRKRNAPKPTEEQLAAGRRARFRVHIIVVPGTDQDDIVARFARLGLPATVKKRSHSSADSVEVSSVALALWLEEHFGKNAARKVLPPFVLFLADDDRQAFLDGYCSGDAHRSKPRARWVASTASKRLAIGVKLLAQSLGIPGLVSVSDPAVTQIGGVALKKRPLPSWHVQMPDASRAIHEGGRFWSKVNASWPHSAVTVYNPVVEEDGSYIADGIVCHNTHPVQLEMDEGQDFPEGGYREIRATLRRELASSQWRIHGVTTGIPNEFHKMTQPEVPFSIRPYLSKMGFWVHRYMAYHKPTFDTAEEEANLQLYGSRNAPEWRRNICGLHGDAANPIFVTRRLMHCSDSNEASDYNLEEYWKREIRFEQIEEMASRQNLTALDHGRLVCDMLDFPPPHHQYKVFWAGMDVGIARDPSEILVCAEYVPKAPERRRDERQKIAVPLEGDTRLKLVARLNMLRFPITVQAEALMALINFYRPRAFAVDATGNGLGMLQILQQLALRSRIVRIEIDADVDEDLEAQAAAKALRLEAKKDGAEQALTVIKGYNFGGKVVVEIDEEKAAALPANVSPEELAEKAGIKRLVKEHATDVCRDLVDTRRLMLPYDDDLLKQMNGQTWTYTADPVDAYGNRRRTFSRGEFHAFDGLRMLALGHALAPIEALLKAPPKKRAPVYDRFVEF